MSKREKFICQRKKKESEDFVMVSCVLCEMIAKSLRPFTERGFIKDCMLKAADILRPGK